MNTMSVLFVRKADNVLDPQDWPLRKLYLRETGLVFAHQDVALTSDIRGMSLFSEHDPREGWGIVQLSEWSRVDPTGNHPEIYHELRAFCDSAYFNFLDINDIRRMVRRGLVVEGEEDFTDRWIIRIEGKQLTYAYGTTEGLAYRTTKTVPVRMRQLAQRYCFREDAEAAVQDLIRRNPGMKACAEPY